MLLDLWPFQESGVPAPVIPYRKRGVVLGGFTRRAPGDPAFVHCGPSGTVPYTAKAPSAADYADPNAAPATAYTRNTVVQDSFRKLGVVASGFTKQTPVGPVFVRSVPGSVPYVSRAPEPADFSDPDALPTTTYTRSEP